MTSGGMYQLSLRPQDSSAKNSSSPHTPHELPKPTGHLRVIDSLTPPRFPEDKRLSALANGDLRRHSQISATSTNGTIDSSRPTRKKKKHIGPWMLGVDLGRGATGRVRKARHQVTGKDAAIKIISRKQALGWRSQSTLQMDAIAIDRKNDDGRDVLPCGLDREIIVMKLMDHANIIKLYDVWENRGELYLAMEYVNGGELFTYIRDQRGLPEHECVRIFRQIISGVDYCHRFNLCHRDIKPENILLDDVGNVKLADFGMAALQPRGKMLKTSCGSPHYAAPEIAKGIEYDGRLSDIWSCGVVLYVMLCGCNPFGAGQTGEQVEDVLHKVIQAKIRFPPGYVSDHAKDLVIRILQRDPLDRISIAEMWNHPLLTCYEQFARSSDYKQTWLGGPLPDLTIEDCGRKIRFTRSVDKEILRNLCILWQCASEDDMLKELLSDEPNYQKVIYSRLFAFREEQLEDYERPTFAISNSDYHHVSQPLRRSSTRTTMSRAGCGRSSSTFTIMEDNVRRHVSNRTTSEAETEHSYDPFRPSRRQLIPHQTNYARVTLIKSDQVPSGSNRLRDGLNSLRHPAISKIQDDERGLTPSSSSRRPFPSQMSDLRSRRNSAPTWCTSSSLASSQLSFASSNKIRIPPRCKRPVSFKHIRKRSTSYNLSTSSPPDRERQRKDLGNNNSGLRPMKLNISEPELPMFRIDRPESTERPGHLRRGSHVWKEEARQVSSELEKVCDEAFTKRQYDPRVSSSSYHSIGIETPSEPSPPLEPQKHTVPQQHRFDPRRRAIEAYADRPLPPVPGSRNMDPYLRDELSRTKEALLRSAKELPDHSIDNAIAQLDRLLKASKTPSRDTEDAGRRISSAPEPRHSHPPCLSPLREEHTELHHLSRRQLSHRPLGSHRVVSEPSGRAVATGLEPAKVKSTIRLVGLDFDHKLPVETKEQSLPSQDESHSATSNQQSHTNRISGQTYSGSLDDQDTVFKRESRSEGKQSYRSTGVASHRKHLMPIPEDDDKENVDPKRASVEGKFKAWFKRNQQKDLGTTDIARAGNRRHSAEADTLSEQSYGSRDSPEGLRAKERSSGPSKFLKLFGKKEPDPTSRFALSDLVIYPDGNADIDETVSLTPSSILSHDAKHGRHLNGGHSTSTFGRARRTSRERIMPGTAQNWFSRFLHLRPASETIAFSVPRQTAVKQVYAVMKGWRKFGLSDLRFDRKQFRIFAKVDRNNSLNVRPVSIFCEFFAVYQDGGPGGQGKWLALAHFTQEQGAKSSFTRFVNTMEDIMAGRGLLVRNREKARVLRQVLKEHLKGM